MYDLIIVGGGIVGFGAAIYAGRFHMKTLILSEISGGTLILTDHIENYPGFKKISGQDLFDKVKAHAEDYDVEAKEEKVEKIEKTKDGFSVRTLDKEYLVKTILLATGTEWRKLGVPGEKEFTGNGVHYCALCDGYIYHDKVIAVVGGSDSAAKEALLLSEYAKKVYIIYRKEKIRAEPINSKRVADNPKIEIINHTNVVKILGDKVVNKVIQDKEYKGKKELALDGLFIDIGHIPISQLVEGLGVKVNDKKEIVVNRDAETSVPGVYAAGDVTDQKFKQAITGVAEGVSAVYSAYQYVNS